MPADHLTEATPAQLAAAGLAILSGQDEETASADHDVPAAELAEAVQTYVAGARCRPGAAGSTAMGPIAH
ncbi:hypothetical protein [Actinomadura verrucosospora]|uniref:hypothetical protein n=1 Tax=Actinomadura verrucosospora TaxID=46165 RepID=UPI001FE530D8|nr:hypothetical protein [Actinomadura verrucosospora]